jgi:protocatechuate 3,4-dioxygenase beta subunit
MTRFITAALAVSAIGLTQAQSPSLNLSRPPTQVSGQVVADETGDPIANAQITLTPAGLGTSVVMTDGNGSFGIMVPATASGVAAMKSGYARREVAASAGPVQIRLRRGAVISGRVVDEFGDPIVAAHLVAQTVSTGSGNMTTAAAADTDDLGEYRLARLPAGTFVVTVVTLSARSTPQQLEEVRAGRSVGSAAQTIYYPGVAVPSEAQALQLQWGEHRSGIDFVVAATQSTGNPFSVAGLAPPLDRAAVSQNPRATGVIRGRVISTDGRPLPYAQVTLLHRDRRTSSSMVTAEADGRFEFRDVVAGALRVVASKAGYAPIPSEPAEPGPPILSTGRAVDLRDGEIRERVDVTLARWGTLAGRVFDELGDPVQGATVDVLQVRYQAGRRRLVHVQTAAHPTDDLGQYRLFALSPGQYIVSAVVGDVASMDVPGYVRSYFPGTPTASDAQFVAVAASQEVAGRDFAMFRGRTARISGRIMNAAGEPKPVGSLTLIPAYRSTAVTSVPVGARLFPDGRFEFPNVPDGQYIIRADRGRTNRSTEGEFGVLPVSVNGAEVTNLILQTSPGSSIKGRLRFDASRDATTPNPSAIELSPIPVDVDASPSRTASAEIHPDWTFEVAGIIGPRRLQLLHAPSEWALKEILINGIDVIDRLLPFGRADQSLSDVEVVLTDRVNEVTGRITDEAMKPVPGSFVLVFATDRDRWYPASRFLRAALAGSDGTFSLTGLPFGSYYAVAVRSVPSDGDEAWQDPQFLTSLIPRASAVTLGAAQKVPLNLRLATSR